MKQNFLYNNYLLTRLTYTEMIKQFTAKGLDFKPEHFLILALLDHYKQMRQKDIAHGTIKSKATITRAISKLVNEGIVKRNNGVSDRREKMISMTEKGEQIFWRLRGIFIEIQKYALDSVANEDLRKFLHVLRVSIQNLEVKNF